jgi:NADH-quinone oxidoreductase subunit C
MDEGKDTPQPGAPPPAAAPAKPAAAPKPAKAEAATYQDIGQDPLVTRLQKEVPGSILSAQIYLGQKILHLEASRLLDLCEFLRHDHECDYDLLQDVTALDYPEREKRFVVVHHLCSLRRNVMLRLKTQIGEGDSIESVTSIWPGADWLEREAYDMFGIVFSGHPDLRRILLPEDWVGYPLRKDYDLRKQDEEWIRRHLQIRK